MGEIISYLFDFRVFVGIIACIVCCYVGANNPEWFSQKARDAKKFIDDTKTAEGRKAIIADAIAEYERMKGKV